MRWNFLCEKNHIPLKCMVKIIILMTMFDLIDLICIVKLHPHFPIVRSGSFLIPTLYSQGFDLHLTNSSYPYPFN
jgi:hypothetical protein